MAAVTWKCPNCGGGLLLDPSSQKFKCEYCLSEFSKEQISDLPPKKGRAKARRAGTCSLSVSQLRCGDCDRRDDSSHLCFYCHNPVVLKGRLEGGYKPDYVLPFAIDKEKAKDIFLQWLKQKRFVPKDFYSPEQIEKLTGVYFPYWLYSCQVEGKSGRGCKA